MTAVTGAGPSPSDAPAPAICGASDLFAAPTSGTRPPLTRWNWSARWAPSEASGSGPTAQALLKGAQTVADNDCDYEHPHPDHPCGRHVINGVTRCPYCGNLDGSPECDAAGCWQPMTEELLDGLYLEAWGLHNDAPPAASDGEQTESCGGDR